ncbi:MAG: DUF308 domain-containing protein [Proteobacteria bacterium]|nr:DUF308 domain-containing protein [Pseudomonadota bacterium]
MDSVQNSGAKARRAWGWMLAYGILLILAGWFAAFNPIATSVAVGIMLGIALLFAGIASIIAAFREFGWQAKLVDVLFGALALGGAFLVLAMPVLSATSLVWAVGIFFIVNGAFELINGFKASEDKVWLILMGVIDLALGIYISTFMPVGAQIVTLAWFVGLGFIIRGIILSLLAVRVRGLINQPS